MAILYKGYAQEKGFGANLVNVPDPSKKIREQGLVAMGHMKDEIEWNNKQANLVTAALERNNQIEAKNRSDNFELSQEIGETIANQKWRNFETKIKLRESKRKAAEKNIQDLLKLTTTGAKVWKQYDANQKEKADVFAQGLYEEHGIGLKKLNAIQDLTAEVWNDSAQREAALRDMGLEGVPADVVQRLRSLGGYRSIAIAKFDARRWAGQRGSYYDNNYNTKVPLPGIPGGVDLASAKTGAQVDSILQQLDARARREMGPNAPSSKMMALSGGYAIMENARASIRRNKRQDLIKAARKAQHDDEFLMLDDAIGPGPNGDVSIGAGVMKTIHFYAGHTEDTPASAEALKAARGRVTEAIIAGLKDGKYTWDQFKELENHKFKHSSGETTFGNIFKKEWRAIEDAAIDGHKKLQGRANLEIEANKVKDLDYRSELLKIAKTNPDPSMWSKYLSIAEHNDWEQSRVYISNKLIRGQTQAADRTAKATVLEMIERQEFISQETIEQLGASPSAEATLTQLAQESNKWLPQAGGNDSVLQENIEAMLERRISTKITGNQNGTRGAAERSAMAQATAQYKAFMTQPGATHDKALEHSLKYIQERIFDDSENSLYRKYYNKTTDQWEFGGFSINGTVDPIEIDNDTIGISLSKDPNSIYTRGWMDINALKTKAENLVKGRHQSILPRSAFISANTRGNVTALEAEMAQIEYYNKILKENGQALIPEYPDWYVNKVKDTYSKFVPEQHRLLESFNYCDINKAACASGKNPVYNRPTLTKARDIVNDTLGGVSYDATEKGSSIDRKDILNIDITQATLRQILMMQENGSLVTVGRYQFDHDTLKEAISLGQLSLNERFTPDTQNILFDVYFKKNGGTKFTNQLDNEDDRFMLESIYNISTAEEFDSVLAFHNPALLRNKKVYQLVKESARYAV